MDAKEFHVGLDLELQKINSSVITDILPQEKDWFINKEVLKYINKKINPEANPQRTGFDDTMKRIDDLRTLKETRVRSVETDSAGRKVIYIPANCYKIIRTDIGTVRDCGQNFVVPTTSLYRSEIPINFNADLFTSFSIQLVTSSGSKTIFTHTDMPSGYIQTLDFKKQRFMLWKAMKIIIPRRLDTFYTSDYDVYYEFDRDKYRRNTIIIYSLNTGFEANVTFNGVTTTYTSTKLTINKATSSLYPIEAEIREVDDEFFNKAKNSYLSKSTAKSIVSRISKSFIELSPPKGVLLGPAKITYLSKPILNDVFLDSNINLDRNSLNEILVNTVAYIKAVVESRDYPTYKNENILIE